MQTAAGEAGGSLILEAQDRVGAVSAATGQAGMRDGLGPVRKRHWHPAAVLALVALTAGSCATETVGEACTAAGCESGVSVEVTPLLPLLSDQASSLTAELCVDGDCRMGALGGGDLGAPPYHISSPQSFGPESKIEQVTLRLTSSDSGRFVYEGSTTAATRPVAFRPNGRRCPPVCYRVNLVATEAELLLSDPAAR